nr:piggyBac transposable element-derived protein 4-like isoform X2 [Nomia melanderi]
MTMSSNDEFLSCTSQPKMKRRKNSDKERLQLQNCLEIKGKLKEYYFSEDEHIEKNSNKDGTTFYPKIVLGIEEWSNDHPQRNFIQFIGKPGLKKSVQEQTPFSYFSLFFTSTFLKLLVTETNAYAEILFLQEYGERTRISDWKDTSVDEIKIFLGILFLMGLIRINRMNDCWKKHYLFNLPFGKFMGRDRFLLLLRCLHFDRLQHSSDNLHKINTVIDYFNYNMDTIYSPSRNLLIEDSMIFWAGQYKKHKYRLKLHTLSEPCGIINELYLHFLSNKNAEDKHCVQKVVHKLLEGKIGNVNPNKINNLPEIVKKKLIKEECVYNHNNQGVCCCKWKDKKNTYAISSEFGGELVKIGNKHGMEKKKPKLINEYNKQMQNRLDRQDPMLSYYPLTHKFLQWYKKLGIHIIHIMLNNAHFFYNKYNGGTKKDLHDFQFEIVSTLLPPPEQNIPLFSPQFKIHLPELLPKGINNRTMRKRCKLCNDKKNIRLDTIYHCPDCPSKPGLCLSPCFREFHNYK